MPDKETGRTRHEQAVPGKKVDHKGLILNPQPHRIVTMAGKTCDLSQGINLKDKQDKFAGYLDFLSPNKKGVKLTIDFGQKVASKANVKAVSGKDHLPFLQDTHTGTPDPLRNEAS